MYSVVEFEENDQEPVTVEVAPTSWLVCGQDGKRCYWPPFRSTSRITKAVCERKEVDLSWSTFGVRRVMGSSDVYEKARSMTQKAVYTSDLQSDAEPPKKRKRRNNRKYIESEEESDCEELVVPSPPPVPQSLRIDGHTPSPPLSARHTSNTSSPPLSARNTSNTSSPPLSARNTSNTSSPPLSARNTSNTASPPISARHTSNTSSPPISARHTSNTSSPPLSARHTSNTSSPPLSARHTSNTSSPPLSARNTSNTSIPPLSARNTSNTSSPPLSARNTSNTSSPPISARHTSNTSSPPLSARNTSNTSSPPLSARPSSSMLLPTLSSRPASNRQSPASSTVSRHLHISQLQPSPVEKKILANQAAIETKLTNLSALVNLLANRLDVSTEGNVKLPDDMVLPVETNEELRHLETKLLDSQTADILVGYLGLLGGKNVKDTVWNIMSQVMTNKLAEEYNMTGRGQKAGFEGMVLHGVVLKAVRGNPVLRRTTEVEINEKIRDWLKYSKDRDGGKKKREERRKQLDKLSKQLQEREYPETETDVSSYPEPLDAGSDLSEDNMEL